MATQGHSRETRIKREAPWGFAAIMLLAPFLPIVSASMSQDSISPGGTMNTLWLT